MSQTKVPRSPKPQPAKSPAPSLGRSLSSLPKRAEAGEDTAGGSEEAQIAAYRNEIAKLRAELAATTNSNLEYQGGTEQLQQALARAQAESDEKSKRLLAQLQASTQLLADEKRKTARDHQVNALKDTEDRLTRAHATIAELRTANETMRRDLEAATRQLEENKTLLSGDHMQTQRELMQENASLERQLAWFRKRSQNTFASLASYKRVLRFFAVSQFVKSYVSRTAFLRATEEVQRLLEAVLSQQLSWGELSKEQQQRELDVAIRRNLAFMARVKAERPKPMRVYAIFMGELERLKNAQRELVGRLLQERETVEHLFRRNVQLTQSNQEVYQQRDEARRRVTQLERVISEKDEQVASLVDKLKFAAKGTVFHGDFLRKSKRQPSGVPSSATDTGSPAGSPPVLEREEQQPSADTTRTSTSDSGTSKAAEPNLLTLLPPASRHAEHALATDHALRAHLSRMVGGVSPVPLPDREREREALADQLAQAGAHERRHRDLLVRESSSVSLHSASGNSSVASAPSPSHRRTASVKSTTSTRSRKAKSDSAHEEEEKEPSGTASLPRVAAGSPAVSHSQSAAVLRQHRSSRRRSPHSHPHSPALSHSASATQLPSSPSSSSPQPVMPSLRSPKHPLTEPAPRLWPRVESSVSPAHKPHLAGAARVLSRDYLHSSPAPAPGPAVPPSPTSTSTSGQREYTIRRPPRALASLHPAGDPLTALDRQLDALVNTRVLEARLFSDSAQGHTRASASEDHAHETKAHGRTAVSQARTTAAGLGMFLGTPEPLRLSAIDTETAAEAEAS